MYEGDYLNDKKSGFGIYTWADGRQYHGMWKDGKQHGEGKYILPSGVQRRGYWRDGVREKWLDAANQVTTRATTSIGGDMTTNHTASKQVTDASQAAQ